jgi:hypothetical protein
MIKMMTELELQAISTATEVVVEKMVHKDAVFVLVVMRQTDDREFGEMLVVGNVGGGGDVTKDFLATALSNMEFPCDTLNS